MIIKKEITDDNEFYLYFNGKLIYKKWLDQGYSKVFDHFAWGKYTENSITDFDLEETPSELIGLTTAEEACISLALPII